MNSPGRAAGPAEFAASQRPTLADIRAAHDRIRERIHRTPVITSSGLDAIAGARLFFKCENLQKAGSFKIRGATNAVFSLSEEEARRGVVTHSSGNHAAAVAQAAGWRGIPAWVVMPSNSSRAKLEAVKSYGATVIECEPTLAAREAAASEVLARTGAHFVHPYNDARVIAGQGTAALELLEDVPDLDAIIAPVSGGGLLSGTAIAAKAARPQIRVVGGEPRNADDARRSLRSGAIEPPSPAHTIADGLRAALCPLTFSILRDLCDEICLVTEDEIVQAMRLLWERAKMVVEPSGAVAAAPALFRRISLWNQQANFTSASAEARARKIGVILSGGNLDLDHLPFGPAAP